MTKPRGTVWNLEPHTLAKHAILEEYLKAWFPILGSLNTPVLYYDGFAGPGEYETGEPGSPVIALKVAIEHQLRLPTCFFKFSERDETRARHLSNTLSRLKPADNIHYEVIPSSCEDALKQLLEDPGLHIPTFALIDPFGVSDVPFDLVARLLSRTSCEVLLTFMTFAIRRFVGQYPERINSLVGDPQAANRIQEAEDRVATARELYTRSLRRVARYVRFFEMRNTKDAALYDLFFATNSLKGLGVMKTAMWKADDTGSFSFSDAPPPTDYGQLKLFPPSHAEDLAEILQGNFSGQTVQTGEIFRFTMVETRYLERHAKHALGHLEEQSEIAVQATKTNGRPRREGTFPEGVVVEFA